MEAQYEIDLEKNTIISIYSGLLNASELICHTLIIRNDPKFHKGLNTIADFRQATLPETHEDLFRFLSFINFTAEERGAFRLAIITDETRNNGMLELYKTLSEFARVKIFTRMEQAKSWLEVYEPTAENHFIQ